MSQPRRYWTATTYRVTPELLTEVQAAARLTWAERAVCATLLDHDYHLHGYRKGVVWCGARRLAEETGCCERTVGRCVDKLESAGYIARRQRGHGRTALTVIAWERLVPSGPGSLDSPYPLARTRAPEAPKQPGAKPQGGYLACGGEPRPDLRDPFTVPQGWSPEQPPPGLSWQERAAWRAERCRAA